MNALYNFLSAEFIEAFGWTIIHSLWQGILIAGAIIVVFSLMHRNSAQVKYLIGYFGLILMLGWSILTFSNAYEYASEKNALKQNLTATSGFAKMYIEKKITQYTIETPQSNSAINLNTIKLRSFFQRNFHIVVAFWMAGFLLLVFRMAGGLLYNYKLRTRGVIAVDQQWIKTISEYSKRLKIKQKIDTFFSPLVNSPLTLGVFKPVILFPVAAFTGLSIKDVEAIIAHELAHIARRDYFFNIIQSLIKLIYFYHPGVWIISSLIDAERENSCDNIAIRLTGDKNAYIRTLANAELSRNQKFNPAMAFASHRGSILNRIKHIQKQKAMKTNFIEGLIAATIVITGFALVSFTSDNSAHSYVLSNNEMTLETSENTPPLNTKEWTKHEVDSLQTGIKKQIAENENLDGISEEIERMVEIALSESNSELQAEILADIHSALADIDINKTVNEAMREAQNEIRSAQHEIDKDEIRRDMEDARRDIQEARREIEEARREVNEDLRKELENTDGLTKEMIELSIEAANAGINIASTVLNSIDIEAIVSSALSGVSDVLEELSEMDIDSINNSDSFSQDDIDRLKKDLEEKEAQIKAEKKRLKELEKELKK